MGLAVRVRLKSDRRARALIFALCIAPVATPLLAAGINSLMKSPAPASPMTLPVLEAFTLRPALRADLDDAMLSPAPMGVARTLEPALPVANAAASVAIPQPRVLGSRVLRDVTIRDGLQIGADGVVFALAGVAPSPPGSECRRLDGVVEPCAVRATNRLEVLTRGRPVVCDVQEGDGGELRGVCRAGKIDLAEDLVRNGLAVAAPSR
ncbi:MAG: hypothetical protein JWN07_3584 [Hyphomicrobiales bacterium]|nr:hypothetical protein [Hyphomicrobiales bacterium]